MQLAYRPWRATVASRTERPNPALFGLFFEGHGPTFAGVSGFLLLICLNVAFYLRCPFWKTVG